MLKRTRWRGLELPSMVSCDKETLTDRYGKFVAEPFERGFGTTVGNSLRRILLSSLEGAAVTQMKLQGVSHEFTTLEGVLEDVTDIVLNVKSLIVRSESETPRVLRIEKHSVGPITGADIQTDHQVEIINKDHLIATLTKDVNFAMEMVVEKGRGYVPASERHNSVQETIPLDATFSPVTRVRYEVVETRVGQKTNYDKLIMEIWTDGSINPQIALVEAAKILRKHLNPFVQCSELGEQIHTERKVTGNEIDPIMEAKLSMSVSELHLGVRASNCLETAHIATIRDLVSKTEDELLEVRNFGETSLKEIREKLQENGLQLGMRLPVMRTPQF
ncbi:MAG: DNA-directed RNA polymerase subunit alpha [Thermoguttaceae bacterium]|nr:DNA-directed RNA polymerase subunit alpha [Thermoguttaceae bacterium]